VKIAVLGTGRMGSALAAAFARRSHEVRLVSREPARARERAASISGSVEPALAADAVRWSDAVALACLWDDAPTMISLAGDFRGKTLIDATNPEGADGRELVVGGETSGAEELARLARGARLVKAFNHVYAELLDGSPLFSGRRASAFLCGDDREAKGTASCLAAGLGFSPVDVGPLSAARLLEPMAALMVQIVRGTGRPPGSVALALLSRTEAR